jgi:hypothetical protein
LSQCLENAWRSIAGVLPETCQCRRFVQLRFSRVRPSPTPFYGIFELPVYLYQTQVVPSELRSKWHAKLRKNDGPLTIH